MIKLNLKHFKLNVVITTLGIVLVPLIIITQLLFSFQKSSFAEKNYKYMNRIREEKAILIKEILNQNLFDIQNIIKINSSLNLSPDVKTSNIINSKPNINRVVNYDFNFKPKSNLHSTGYMESGTIPGSVRETLQNNFYFSSFYYKDLIDEENYPILVLFTKDQISNEYYSISFNYDYFNRYFKEYRGYKIDIYNSKFQIISSSKKNVDPRKVYNNLITEKMGKGFNENALYNDNYYSFGHIELNDEELYITVSIPKGSLDEEFRSTTITLYILYLLFSVIAFIVGIYLVKYFYNLKEEDIQNEVFSDRFTFFYRLNSNLKKLDSDFNSVASLNKSLNYLKNDLEIIMDNIPDGAKGDE